LLDVLAKVWLAAVIVPMSAAVFRHGLGGAISRIGRHSLPVFIVGTFLSVFGSVIVHEADHHVLADIAVTSGGIAILLFTGWLLENGRNKASAPVRVSAANQPSTTGRQQLS
jgi:hypothetical protein